MKVINKTTERIKVRVETEELTYATVYPQSEARGNKEVEATSDKYAKAYKKAGLTEVKVEKKKAEAPKEEKKKTVKEKPEEKPKEKPKSIVGKAKDLIKGKRR